MSKSKPSSDYDVATGLTSLNGVGPQLAEKLARLRLHTIQDLLFHLPSRYQDRTRLVPIGSLVAGQECLIQGTVQHAEVRFARRRMLLVVIADGSGSLLLRFFHFNKSQQQRLITGSTIRCFGEVRKGAQMLEMVHPEYRLTSASARMEQSLRAVYPAGDGVSQTLLNKLIDQALPLADRFARLIPDTLTPADCRLDPAEALRLLHRPTPEHSVSALMEGSHPAQQSLAFEELTAQMLGLKRQRKAIAQNHAFAMQSDGRMREQFIDSLDFALTGAQQRVAGEILADLIKPTPMMRLVQGDVGSGKTVVAAIAALQAIESGYQVAMMAPTEILAEQHHTTLSEWLTPLGVKLAWHSGRQKVAERREMQQLTRSGEAKLVVGTHALFQDAIEFHSLGLFIIDEQHRFGVHQRLALQHKGKQDEHLPHQLIMTATPIPRTLAMTAYVDLDLSVIDELPPGREPVATRVVPIERREMVMQRIAAACEQGRQCYWVCTLIEESDKLQCQAAEESFAQMQAQLPQLQIGLVHGRMKSAEKDQVMQAFKQGELQVLVATTVIEVGVDVPNASLMIIENAERLGLSQLHQLRGRVGRGSAKSHCLLLFKGPLSDGARERLAALRETNDGFKIAEIDLELRGPGELLGTRQTGIMNFRIADLHRHRALLPAAQRAASRMIEQNPDAADALIDRWHGSRAEYQTV